MICENLIILLKITKRLKITTYHDEKKLNIGIISLNDPD